MTDASINKQPKNVIAVQTQKQLSMVKHQQWKKINAEIARDCTKERQYHPTVITGIWQTSDGTLIPPLCVPATHAVLLSLIHI